MKYCKTKKQIFKIIFLLSLSFFVVPHFSCAAWQAPVGNPYSNNDSFPFIPSVGNDTTYVLDKHLGIDNNFIVGSDTTNALYINESINRTGILTHDPQTTLDVWGVVRIGRMAQIDFPACNSNLLGTMIYNLTQNRLNICVNGTWRRIGYDGDLDHYLDYADCDDDNASLNPGSEICNDMVTNDCDALVNEGCACTAAEWTAPSACPDMSTCTIPITVYGTKTTNCEGTTGRPSATCPCICRTDSWANIYCPSCGTATTIYANLKSGYSCVDTFNTRTSKFCPATGCPAAYNTSNYCDSGDVYYDHVSYSCVSGYCQSSYASYKVSDCSYECSDGACVTAPCVGCGCYGFATCEDHGCVWHCTDTWDDGPPECAVFGYCSPI